MKKTLSYWQSCQLRALVQYGNVKVSTIIADKKNFPGFAGIPSSTLYRHSKYPLDGRDPIDKRKENKGRKSYSKLSRPRLNIIKM